MVAVVAVVVYRRWVTVCVGSQGGDGEPGSTVALQRRQRRVRRTSSYRTETETETEEDWTDGQWRQLQYNDIHSERPTVRH